MKMRDRSDCFRFGSRRVTVDPDAYVLHRGSVSDGTKAAQPARMLRCNAGIDACKTCWISSGFRPEFPRIRHQFIDEIPDRTGSADIPDPISKKWFAFNNPA
ncbi:hypothetical protein [Burkholderia stabilis]|uniref:hypothetical protein n=1 Tax=Burkholderia stabilis TaxID=95485 RepID=UPI0010115EC9|nr:hypothetical protein [Burkholderia stabilis]